MNANIQSLTLAIAGLIRTVANETASNAVKAHKDSAASQVRQLVLDAREAGVPVEQVATAFAAGCKAIKKESRGKGYKMAMLGYDRACEAGTDILTGFGKGENKDKPMPIQAAQKIQSDATATAEEKARAQAVELVRERLAPWLKDGTIAELQAILDVVEVKAGAVKTEHAPVSLDDIIGGFFASDDADESEESDTLQAANG